ncbi:MAG: hypothetical protein P0Y53_24995 [Candidatus Pseudobacter hemicellulosilyticus]|uniref:Uncharacterized protein n=1 Tax=Candidatus Pseudobacter hemicellulosilyticus TaxID=3121375 RepID=A0AAJ5WPH1_9BACT|nr:MAG: hypothetical protein P0Y53_24995 [Pseudobacter sp.]
MNQLFNSRRFLLLTGLHWNEHRKRYLGWLAAVAGLLMTYFLFVFFMNDRKPLTEDYQAPTYFVVLFMLGGLYASTLFAPLGDKSKGITWLLLPASQLEKLLVSLFYGILVFYISYTAVFYLVDIAAVKLTNSMVPELSRYDYNLKQFVTDRQQAAVSNMFIEHYKKKSEVNVYFIFHMAFLAIQSIFIAGSIWCRRFAFVKTLLAGLAFGALYIFFFAKVLDPRMPRGHFTDDFMEYRFESFLENGKYVAMPAWLIVSITVLAKYAVAPLCWILTYIRLKEKQL